MIKIYAYMGCMTVTSIFLLSMALGWGLNLVYVVLGILGLASALNLYWAMILRRQPFHKERN